MMEYQYWLTYFNILISMLIILLAWNSSFWIKDKINRFLVFILLMKIYDDILTRLNKFNSYDIATSHDKVEYFIYHAIFDNYTDYITVYPFIPVLLILIYRLIKPIYLKRKSLKQ